MTLFDKQSLSLLSISAGSVSQVYNYYEIGSEFVKRTEKAFDSIKGVIHDWPVREDYDSTFWLVNKMKKWKKAREDVDAKKEIIEFIAIPLLSLTDLQETIVTKVRRGTDLDINQKRLVLLDPLFPMLNDLLYYIDPNGTQFEAFENSTSLLNELYKVLEFYPDK